MTEPPCISGRHAIAIFFHALMTSKAHWYRILTPSSEEPHFDLVCSTFPSLSDLLSLDDEYTNRLLVQLGLAWYKKGHFSPLISAWRDVISEFQLHAEVTLFSINGRQRLYLRLGSWNQRTHPHRTPSVIWKKAMQDGTYPLPKLRISSLSMRFASAIGALNLGLFHEVTGVESSGESYEEEKSIESSTEEDEVSECSDMRAARTDVSFEASQKDAIQKKSVSNLSSSEFPLLSSLGVHSDFMDKVLQELVKYHGKKTIEFMGSNNRKGYLISFPSLRTANRYDIELSKKGSVVDEIVKNICESASVSEAEAAECVIRSLHNRYEQSFVSVGMEKGVINGDPSRKMDAASVEAMLSEARLNTKNSRTLFKHLRLFFGRSYFESEVKRREYFSGQDFPPTVKEKVLEDKTIVPHWYKLPDELVQHQLKTIVQAEQLHGLKRVDFTIGGDHGGGKFRMTLKVLFRFENSNTISKLFQIASVSHSKDETEILRSTVIDPIGEGERRIV
jgi:hypothetical protein